MVHKDDGAFLTIGEVAARFGVAAHILRYWETKFARLRPLQRAGNRRYYRPDDVAMVAQINRLLNEQGYTVNGAVKLLSGRAKPVAGDVSVAIPSDPVSVAYDAVANPNQTGKHAGQNDIHAAICQTRDRLVAALAAA